MVIISINFIILGDPGTVFFLFLSSVGEGAGAGEVSSRF